MSQPYAIFFYALIALCLMKSTQALAESPASGSDDGLIWVDAEGHGETEEDALRQAHRSAVEKVVGVAMMAETRVSAENYTEDIVKAYGARVMTVVNLRAPVKSKTGVSVAIRAGVKRAELQRQIEQERESTARSHYIIVEQTGLGVTEKAARTAALKAAIIEALGALSEGRTEVHEKIIKEGESLLFSSGVVDESALIASGVVRKIVPIKTETLPSGEIAVTVHVSIEPKVLKARSDQTTAKVNMDGESQYARIVTRREDESSAKEFMVAVLRECASARMIQVTCGDIRTIDESNGVSVKIPVTVSLNRDAYTEWHERVTPILERLATDRRTVSASEICRLAGKDAFLPVYGADWKRTRMNRKSPFVLEVFNPEDNGFISYGIHPECAFIPAETEVSYPWLVVTLGDKELLRKPLALAMQNRRFYCCLTQGGANLRDIPSKAKQAARARLTSFFPGEELKRIRAFGLGEDKSALGYSVGRFNDRGVYDISEYAMGRDAGLPGTLFFRECTFTLEFRTTIEMVRKLDSMRIRIVDGGRPNAAFTVSP